jgi:hypothetical protein
MDALTLLDRAREAGLVVARDGDRIIVRGPRQAEPVVRLLAARKREVLTALAEATSWRARLAYWGVLHSPAEAACLAWGELEKRWHRFHGAKAPEWQCAGCGEPIGGHPALRLADGNRVHFDDDFRCLLRFGERWRREATAGLKAFGLDPPREFTT